MREDLVFVLAQAVLGLLGGAAAFHPSARGLSRAARLSVAYAAGTVALTLEATLFSTLRIPWSTAGLAAPLLALSALLTYRWRRRPAEDNGRPLPRAGLLPVALALVGFGYLALSLAASASTSVDYLLFWGVKAVRFAEARGIDAAFLRSGYSYHAVTYYPPLVPIVDAWGVLASGKMPWRLLPPWTLVWPVATAAVLFDLLRRRLPAGGTAIASFWSVALSFSLAYSYSGANGEAPLLFFETVALAFVLTESSEKGESRFLPGIALCGAALTKVEGTAAAALIAAGTLLRDGLLAHPRPFRRALLLAAGPLIGLATWFVYERSIGLPLGYRFHGERFHRGYTESIAKSALHFSNAGTLWLSWVFPVLLLIVFAKRWKSILPALTLSVGVLGLLAFDYFHYAVDPATLIGWTLPRISQAALSAVILGGGVASLQAVPAEEPRVTGTPG